MIAEATTEAEALELLAIREKAGAHEPEKGTHVGAGRHVQMPETWDGSGKVPAGWSGLAGVYFDEEKAKYVLEVVELDNVAKAKLSAEELKKLDDAIRAEKPIEEEKAGK
jgi:hypothetical protein